MGCHRTLHGGANVREPTRTPYRSPHDRRTDLMDTPGKLVVRTYARARRWVIERYCCCSPVWRSMSRLNGALQGRFRRHAGGIGTRCAAPADRAVGADSTADARAARRGGRGARIAEVRERSEVARTIGELQAQVERQQAGCRVLPWAGGAAWPERCCAGRVAASLHIAPLPGNQAFALRFSLNRLQRPGRSAQRRARHYGRRHTRWQSGQHRSCGDDRREERLPFNVRYTTSVDQEVILPPDFKPERVTIELRPDRKGVTPYRQTFVWTVDPS